MMDPNIVQKASETPTPGSTESASFCPCDVIPESTRRLGWVALLFAGGFLVAFPGWLLLDFVQGRQRPYLELYIAVNLIAIALGLAVFALVRYSKIRPDTLLDFGLIFLVLGSFCLSMTQFWGIWPEWSDSNLGNIVGVPWECCWILIFPLLAPNTPGKTLLAALAAASTAPLVFLLSKSVGATSPAAPVPLMFGYFMLSTYLCAGIAFVTSCAVNKLAKQLRKAREVGSYQLVERLGQGGMGEVWVAKHRMLARPAAVKLIRPEMLGADERSRRMAIRRFEREAQATAALKSYHTIDLYDFGVTDDSAFYYVMELLHGLSLDSLVKRFGPVPAGRAVYLLRQVCHSLGEAHASGMVHRDIKPANIHVGRIGPDFSYDFVKVLDFGLVKSRDGMQQGATELTADGLAAGTPAFMAPESALGKSDVDGRADIYCLGCVAYWLVTGQRVFDADSPLATALAHVQEQPIPPSQKTELEIPDSFEQVILACLEKAPADRPQTAGELDSMLDASRVGVGWNTQAAREWWDLHMPEADELADLDRFRDLSPEEIMRIEK
ncbi:MAG: serine/threonine protein kinase [Gemmatimonadota bacterium]|nr:MAG: serine/threonine protein kinase [Gemmatimonadota bacterium]